MTFELGTFSLILGIILSLASIISMAYAFSSGFFTRHVTNPIVSVQGSLDRLKSETDAMKSEIERLKSDNTILRQQMQTMVGEIEDHEDRMRMCETVMTVLKYKCASCFPDAFGKKGGK